MYIGVHDARLYVAQPDNGIIVVKNWHVSSAESWQPRNSTKDVIIIQFTHVCVFVERKWRSHAQWRIVLYVYNEVWIKLMSDVCIGLIYWLERFCNEAERLRSRTAEMFVLWSTDQTRKSLGGLKITLRIVRSVCMGNRSVQ